MDFAKNLLYKYGWKDGEGLGKNSDGIAKPLKASLKFDQAGLGVDQAASDFNNHWWERVFNEAASNVSIKSANDSVIMDLKDHSQTVEITTKEYSLQKLKKAKKNLKYANFLESATLTETGNVVEKPDRITANDIKVKKFKHLTDEELFKACGGRTAHKGARHGLKLSGKLARLEKQEQEMLAKLVNKRTVAVKKEMVSSNQQTNVDKEPKFDDEISVHVKEKKVKKKKRVNDVAPDDLHIEATKKKRQKNDEFSEVPKKTKASEANEPKAEKIKKKKKQKTK